ncbi:MAG: HepT-like ribonuclease domain-containing protein [Armatimonadota bacterium]
MLRVADELASFIAGKSYDDLLADRAFQYVCIHCLELIGEAAAGIDVAYIQNHPDIPWRSAIAMRHRLIHGYFDIDLEIVWHAATEDIPALVPVLQQLLAGDQ